jgi:twitching motility protein PilU
MIDHRNALQSGHIITIEDPIEFLFKHKRSIVNQRELVTDAKSYQVALKNALRQAPDVILIGEVRDRETMTMAIAYAQSGHLCLATLHANNSYHALNRIISFYPLENRPALLQDLSSSLKCIVSQRLIRNLKGARSPAVEVMLNTRHIADLIEKGEVNEIKEAMDKSLAPGSQTFEQALFQMFRDGIVSQEEALANADSATNLLWLMNNTDPLAAKTGSAPAPKPALQQEVEQAPGGASFSEFKLTFDDEKAA